MIDLSASLAPRLMAASRSFAETVVQRLDFGDRITLVEMLQIGVGDTAARWSHRMPVPLDSGDPTTREETALEGARRSGLRILRLIYGEPTDGRAMHTDIFRTLHIAAEYVRIEPDMPTVLMLLSDMLQSANGVEMARKVPGREWIDEQQRAGLIPRMTGTCVVVVGADPTTAQGVRVREFWREYFRIAGARLDPANYRTTPPDEVPDCR
ncbi:MAG TPA: vWA domain-containing protein [Gemmatimonadales bacterium]|nr:vWA domain-containing protein [Gemmatimonadales bacterium]